MNRNDSNYARHTWTVSIPALCTARLRRINWRGFVSTKDLLSGRLSCADVVQIGKAHSTALFFIFRASIFQYELPKNYSSRCSQKLIISFHSTCKCIHITTFEINNSWVHDWLMHFINASNRTNKSVASDCVKLLEQILFVDKWLTAGESERESVTDKEMRKEKEKKRSKNDKLHWNWVEIFPAILTNKTYLPKILE